MHGKTHTNIIIITVERLIFLEFFHSLLRFLNNSIFDSLPETFEWILRLKSLTKSAQLEIGLLRLWFLNLTSFLIDLTFWFLAALL